MANNPESHYNISKLHMIFAILALFSLASLGALFMSDYSREWKEYQKRFRVMEAEKTNMRESEATTLLESDPDFAALNEEIEEAQKKFDANCTFDNLKAEIKPLETEHSIVTQQYKVVKAELDAAHFRYEAALGHHEDGIELTENEYERLNAQAEELKLKAEDLEQQLKERKKKIDACGMELKELERKKRAMTMQRDLAQRKLEKVDPGSMTFINQIANMMRDLPILDMSNPNQKIDQIVLSEIHDDLIFKQVPKVERCITCHKGITNPAFEDAPQPFTTHPNLELFLNNDSAHPIEEFGCTVCHGGRGRATSFINAVHTPSSEKQKKEWEEKYDWHKLHHWDEPMLPKQYVEAGCFKCHSGETAIKGAEKLNLGLQLIERAGCYNCHEIEKYSDWPKTGPDLSLVASKVSKDWMYKWIIDPKSFRHNTWMPTYFNQSNNNDPQAKERGEQEVHAIVEFLTAKSKEFKVEKMPKKGDVARGEELVASIGCFACHQQQKEPSMEKTTRALLQQQHGPNLIGLGSKTSKEWVFQWLKDPTRYHGETRMPDLRLSDQEAADIAEYLTSDKNDEFDQLDVAPINEQILNQIAFDFLKKAEPTKAAEQTLAGMDLNQKLLFAGEKLISHYGCFACHNIEGFEDAKKIGAELTEEGDKPVNKLDFGFIHIDHSNYAWFEQKLRDPRKFDHAKIKAPTDKLIMPNFNLSDEEVEAITTAILGFVNQKSVELKKKPRTPENLFIEEGQKIVRQLNCNGCHIIEGEGGSISKSVEDWLVKYDGRSESEAESVVPSFSPPNLIGEGKKVQSDWLFKFLHSPTPIRPWLKVRMPTYTFNASHLNILLKYFNALDGEEFPFVDEEDVSMTDKEYKDAEKLFSTEYFGCAQCHIVGDQMPSGSSDSWAPDFALAKTRLKPGWIIEWLKNPSELLPGTKMPTYFDPSSFDASGPEDMFDGDENTQIRMLRNYLMTITESSGKSKTKTKPAEPPQAQAAENL